MMIQSPAGILSALLLIEGLILFLSEHPRFEKFFQFPPAMFWIYFLPMLVSNFGILPREAAIYPAITMNLLPAGIILLLISSDLPAVMKLGRPALIMMTAAVISVMAGAPLVVWLFKLWLPPESWSGFGALSASWMGGSANMVAVKEAIGTPDKIFFPMIVVDTIVSYSWMGILILGAGIQHAYDKWNRSDRKMIDELESKAGAVFISKEVQSKYLPLILAAGFGGAWIATTIARAFAGGAFVWVIILASALGILFSFTSLKKLATQGAPRIGYLLLYFVLTSIGVRADLSGILSAPILILAGFVWILFHGIFILIVARIGRIPLGFAATASQAAIGGPASAPIVGATYEPLLAPVGLLLGILGNVIGTYLGLVTSILCKWAAH
jgi:uncharacterized membrane protein